MFKRIQWKYKVQEPAANTEFAKLVRLWKSWIFHCLLLVNGGSYIVPVCVCTSTQNFWNLIQLNTFTWCCRYLQKSCKTVIYLTWFTFWILLYCFYILFTTYNLFSHTLFMWDFRVLMVQILEQRLKRAWEELKATRGQQIPKTVVQLFHVSSQSVYVGGGKCRSYFPCVKICT